MEIWGYWLVHIDVPSVGLQTTSAPWALSLTPLLGICALSMDDCEHPLLYLPGNGTASQQTAEVMTIQRLLHLAIYPINNHQTQTLRRCQQEPADRSLTFQNPNQVN
jgi:hypothetical protein